MAETVPTSITMTEAEYIETRLNDQIDWYDGKSQWHQRYYKRFKNCEMVLGALVPVLMLFVSDYFWAKVAISCFGSGIVVLGGMQGTNKFQENWLEYRSVCEALRHEKYLYLTRAGAYDGAEKSFSMLVERVESIISHENINWAQINKCPVKKTN